MFVLLARKANVGVILRRGPTKWWHVTLWDTKADRFQSGQWFHGHLYPNKCDLSPDGSLMSYFAGRFSPRDVAGSWIAVSRPPYLTALTLWPVGDTHGGRSVFTDNYSLLVAAGLHLPDRLTGPLSVTEYYGLKKTDPRHQARPCWNEGWEGTLVEPQTRRSWPRYSAWRKTSGKLTLERDPRQKDAFGGFAFDRFPSRARSLYTLYRGEDPVAVFEAHWADWDQLGRLVATVGGRVFAGALDRRNNLGWKQLASLAAEKPERMVAPQWAQHW